MARTYEVWTFGGLGGPKRYSDKPITSKKDAFAMAKRAGRMTTLRGVRGFHVLASDIYDPILTVWRTSPEV